MTFREFHIAMMKDPVLGKLLPLQLRRTYPWLSVEESALCASFIGFRAVPEQGVVKAFDPAYFLKVTCPQCAVRSFERFPPSENGRPMTPRDPQEIRRLTELCDRALSLWDEGSADLDAALAEYNALLKNILEPEQTAVLERFVNA